jgi:hypothetical protein
MYHAQPLKFCLLTAEEPLQGPGIMKGGDVWALVIKSVKASDAGLYMCELNTEPPVRSFHKLTGNPKLYVGYCTINSTLRTCTHLQFDISAKDLEIRVVNTEPPVRSFHKLTGNP